MTAILPFDFMNYAFAKLALAVSSLNIHLYSILIVCIFMLFYGRSFM